MAALTGLLSFIIGLALLIVFLVMASNIATIVKILRRIEVNSIVIKDSLDKTNSQVAPGQMSVAEKAKAYDAGQGR